jgi:hypothetical protein
LIRFYFTLGLFFSFPFLWLAVAFWSWVWVGIALVTATLGCIWFRSAAFSKMLDARHAVVLTDEWMNDVLKRITQSIYENSNSKRRQFKFWRITESEAQCLVWIGRSNVHVFMSQGLLAKANEEQLRALLQNIIQGNLNQVQLENRLYALSLWWEELKGQPNRFRYWFISFWLYPLERILKIAKI